MALKKEIIMPNGIVLNYHRIVKLEINVNSQNNILIQSYLSEQARELEKSLIENPQAEQTHPYTESFYYTLDYNETMNVGVAYDLLKMLPDFIGAEDI